MRLQTLSEIGAARDDADAIHVRTQLDEALRMINDGGDQASAAQRRHIEELDALHEELAACRQELVEARQRVG